MCKISDISYHILYRNILNEKFKSIIFMEEREIFIHPGDIFLTRGK